MYYKSVVITSLILISAVIVVQQSRTMEEVQKYKVANLEQLALKPAIDYLFSSAASMEQIEDIILRMPYAVQPKLAYAVITDKRYRGNSLQKLRLAYQATKAAEFQDRHQLDALFNYVMQQIDPCIFIYNELTTLLPGFSSNEFLMRDERLIKAILRKRGLRLPAMQVNNPLMTLYSFESEDGKPFNDELSPDGSMLAYHMQDNTLVIWHLIENKPIDVLRLPDNFLFDAPLAWSPDSQTLAIADQHGNIYFRNVFAQEAPRVVHKIQGLHPAFRERNARVQPININVTVPQQQFIQQLAIINGVDAEQNIVLVGTKLRHQETWFIERKNIEVSRYFIADTENALYSMSFSPDGGYLATLSEAGKACVWRMEDIQRERQEENEQIVPIFNRTFLHHLMLNQEQPTTIVVSNGAKRLAVGPVYNEIFVFDIELGIEIARKATDSWQRGYQGLGSHAFALSADGRYLAYTFNGNYYIYDLDKNKIITQFVRGHVTPNQLFSPGQSFKGDSGFVSCAAAEHPLVVYGMRSNGNLKATFSQPYSVEKPLAFSNDGTYFVSYGDEKYTVWRLPINYLQGNISWQQLRDLLARACLQIQPHINRNEQ